MILGILWLACHNPEIDQRTGEIKIKRCLKKYGNQQRLKQEKMGWQKQKQKKEKREKEGRKQIKKKKKKPKKNRIMGVKEDSRYYKILELKITEGAQG